jgi:hypothetical protein
MRRENYETKFVQRLNIRKVCAKMVPKNQCKDKSELNGEKWLVIDCSEDVEVNINKL